MSGSLLVVLAGAEEFAAVDSGRDVAGLADVGTPLGSPGLGCVFLEDFGGVIAEALEPLASSAFGDQLVGLGFDFERCGVGSVLFAGEDLGLVGKGGDVFLGIAFLEVDSVYEAVEQRFPFVGDLVAVGADGVGR